MFNRIIAIGVGATVLTSASTWFLQQASRHQTRPNLVVNATIRFSALDGSAADLDGFADGILNLKSLLITDGGTLVLDVPRPIVLAQGDVLLERGGRIGPERERIPRVGPGLVLRSEQAIRVMDQASIRVDGADSGGSIFLCSKTLDLLDQALLSANGGLQAGGSISANASGRVVLGPHVTLFANGTYGGQISIRSCDSRRDAISIRGGKFEALGLSQIGGQIRLDATMGGIDYDSQAAVAFEAVGNLQPGQVLLTGATDVSPILRDLAQPTPSLTLGAQPLVTCECPSFLPALEVTPPTSPTSSSQAPIAGRSTAPGRIVRIEGPAQTLEVTTGGDRTFSTTLDLAPNQLNSIFIAELELGVPGPQVGVSVIQDSLGPNLFIDFPANLAQISTQTTDVAGRVGDMLSGFMGLSVSVNGVPAIVDVGVGNNGTFLARNVPLTMGGATTLTAIGKDALNNTTTRSISVSFQPPPMGMPYMVAFPEGNGQSARVNNQVARPLQVQVFTGNDLPIPNKLVTFRVTRSDGRLSSGAVGGTQMFQAFTNANGIAEAYWTLGSDAGCGNNRVEVSSTQIAGVQGFCASAQPAPARQINLGSGGNQVAEAGGTAPQPLRAWVSDSCNGVQGVPVTFRVVRGGGSIGGQLQATVLTSQTGHAEVPFRLGSLPGSNLVEASFAGNNNAPATFVVFGLARQRMQPTSFKGVVVDNGNQPIRSAACTLEIAGVTYGPVSTDGNGQFQFASLPASGPGHLHVDGLVADSVGGFGVPPGSFPSLSYLVVIIPNVENSLPMGPIPLPRLDSTNDNTTYDANTMGQPTTLTVAGVDGLKMIVSPGSMRLNGSPAPSGTKLSLNRVNHDDVPMPMPDGVASPFAWTLQPAGATFDPPIQIVYPNMTGLPPGAIAYFLNFNHDTGRFEIIGSGHVSEDGAEIRSDPGVGITVAGWGCNCPPYAITEDCKNCNVKVEGPEFACGVPVAYTATVTGSGTLTWSVEDGGNSTVLGSHSVSGGQSVDVTYLFQTPSFAGGPVSSGNKIEARLECDDGLVDESGVGVTTVLVKFDSSNMNVFQANLPSATHDQTLRIFWDMSQTIDLGQYVTIESDPANLAYVIDGQTIIMADENGQALWSYSDAEPDPNRISATHTIIARHRECEMQPAGMDVITAYFVPQSTRTRFNDWFATWSANTDWLDYLPEIYDQLPLVGGDPEPDGCCWWESPQVLGNTGIYHPGARTEMRSAPIEVGGTPNEAGHQAMYLNTLQSITSGVGAGSADRSHPSNIFGGDSHAELDVCPFVWAAQLDGNPFQPGIAVPFNPCLFDPPSVPLLHLGQNLGRYLQVRPATPGGVRPFGTCPSEPAPPNATCD